MPHLPLLPRARSVVLEGRKSKGIKVNCVVMTEITQRVTPADSNPSQVNPDQLLWHK